MRAAFKQCLMGGLPLHHEAILHEIPQANMGNFQEYEKKRTKHTLRDPFEEDSASKKLHGFGNPFKVNFLLYGLSIFIRSFSRRMDSLTLTVLILTKALAQ